MQTFSQSTPREHFSSIFGRKVSNQLLLLFILLISGVSFDKFGKDGRYYYGENVELVLSQRYFLSLSFPICHF